MIKIQEKTQCCGCSACANICPKQAISMVPDSLGFLYPTVNEDLCIKCNLCDKVCSFNENYEKPIDFNNPRPFGVRHKNIEEVVSSRSGAVFIALSDWILDQGGTVYGAGYKDHFRVAHKRATTKEERDEFKGSKYVQSDMGSVLSQVKEDLKAGKKVLFSGTSCQVAGVKSFIKHSASQFLDNLFCIDIVCHGTPSPYVWKEYLSYLEKKEKDSITKVFFRDKEMFGWADHRESVVFSQKGRKSYLSYTYLFYKHIMFRQSCGVCHFANTKKPGDITIADFWGWEKTNADVNKDDKGISLILCNTQKGLDLFHSVESSVYFFPVELEKCLQPNLKHPSSVHRMRIQFEHDFNKYGIKYILKRYGDLGWRYKAKILLFNVKKLIARMKK
ncbi:Coenzyme F420 hydrogenase/dehydrogenase, beta subunit C-terminal domain [Hallerella porci]|uniref:4Fe-4S dicluster protein n=1 Tax=Hallerella porci TaxID=1945871 RepID=A0ABX5LJI6_9BACT|nr:Coenzyme F420 hydrogenase/dehydrogenase, beta subunit C-terminal domain [Hallerella porci]PWK92653.1 4Fe-4S dicluster protein [Hallerella porci]